MPPFPGRKLMRLLPMVAFCAALAGCETPKMQNDTVIGAMEQGCGMATVPFAAYAACVESRPVAANAPNGDLLRLYGGYTKQIASEVAAGMGTDQQARLFMTKLRFDLAQIENQRDIVADASRQARANAISAALLAGSNSLAASSAAQAASQPVRLQTSCVQQGRFLNCY